MISISVTLVVVVAGVVTLIGLLGSPAVVASTCKFGGSSGGGPYLITPIQAQNAALITAVGLHKGLPDHAATVALATSLQETQLQNLPYGDRDSVGLFQQRPSEGWGTTAQIMDPSYAAGAFYDHLARIPGWESLPVTDAAQRVQLSATPDAYAQWSPEAHALAAASTGEVPAGLACLLSSFGGAAPNHMALTKAASAQLGPDPFGTPASTQRGWQVAAWAVANAYSFHLTTVTFGGRTWTSASGTWVAAPVVNHVETSTQ